MKKDGFRNIRYGVVAAVIVCLVVLAVNRNAYNSYTIQKDEELFINPNLLMTGSHAYSTGDYPFLLSVNTNDFSLNEINLDILKHSSISGFHEARPFMIKDQYKVVLGGYIEGRLLILGSSDPYFGALHVELEEALHGERVRAVAPGDITGDGQTDVVIGTRPSGVIKYYTYHDGSWTGSEIDKIDMNIHDVIIANLDGNDIREIYVTASATDELNSQNLPIIPEIIKYTLVKGAWDKKVVWKPENQILQNGTPQRYAHPRYLFTGDFVGSGQPQVVSGMIEGPTRYKGLLLLIWNGFKFSQYFQAIEGGIKATTEIITTGDIDNDGIDEVLVPTLTGEALLLYKWQGNKWKQNVIAKDLIDKNIYYDNIASVAILDSAKDGHQQILYVTASGNNSGGNPKFYTLSYNSAKKEWERVLVASPNLPTMKSWGIFPMSLWKVPPL